MKKNRLRQSRPARRHIPAGAPAGEVEVIDLPEPAGADSVDNRRFLPVLCVVGESRLELFSLSTSERLRRQFSSAGVKEAVPLAQAAKRRGPVILVRADAVLDQPLVAILARRPNLLLMGEGRNAQEPMAVTVDGRDATLAAKLLAGELVPPMALRLLVRSPSELDASFWKGLRKRETPYAFAATSSRNDAEWRVFMGTYKGATDFVTKHLWPHPAYYMTRFMAPLGITPNMVTTVGAILMVLAFWLFLQGSYALGLAAAWLMTFLDTVDGKLARTTITSSKWGDVFDHGIDLVHPPFWYVAWGLGLAHAGLALDSRILWITLAVILAGYVLQRLMEGAAIKWLGLEIHIWREIDTWFRQVTARRNPNLAILTLATIVGRPDWGLIAVAAWTALCLALHGVQLLHAFAVKARSGPLVSWMERPASRP